MSSSIRVCSVLSQQQKQEIADLIRVCQAWEPIHMTPLMDAEENMDPELPCFYLAYEEEGGSLAGFLSLFLPDGETAEGTVFVRPDNRRKGILTALLRKAREVLEGEELSYYLVSDGCSRDADAVAAHWQGKPDHTEWMLEAKAEKLAQMSVGAEREKMVFLRRRGQCWYLYRRDHKHYIGKCFLAPLAEDIHYLYGLEIRPEWRNQGYGKQLLHSIGKKLDSEDRGRKGQVRDKADPQKRRATVLRLQVSSENEAACRLYETCGFQVSEQVIYYCCDAV